VSVFLIYNDIIFSDDDDDYQFVFVSFLKCEVYKCIYLQKSGDLLSTIEDLWINFLSGSDSWTEYFLITGVDSIVGGGFVRMSYHNLDKLKNYPWCIVVSVD